MQWIIIWSEVIGADQSTGEVSAWKLRFVKYHSYWKWWFLVGNLFFQASIWLPFSDSMGCTINPLDFRHVIKKIPCFMVPVLENLELGAWHSKKSTSIHPITDSSTNHLKNGHRIWFLVSSEFFNLHPGSGGTPGCWTNPPKLGLSCRDDSFPTIDVRRKWRGRLLDTLQPSPLPTTPGGTERDP